MAMPKLTMVITPYANYEYRVSLLDHKQVVVWTTIYHDVDLGKLVSDLLEKTQNLRTVP